MSNIKTHLMKLAQAPFEKIANGTKIIESRLFDEKRQTIRIGDILEFSRNDDSTKKVSTVVQALYRYPTFEKMFSDFIPQYFGGDSKEALVKEIEQFYSPEEQSKYGVVGIKIILQ